MSAINIIFDGPPSAVAGRFVEVETDDGRSLNAGEWIERPDGLWALRIERLPGGEPAVFVTISGGVGDVALSDDVRGVFIDYDDLNPPSMSEKPADKVDRYERIVRALAQAEGLPEDNDDIARKKRLNVDDLTELRNALLEDAEFLYEANDVLANDPGVRSRIKRCKACGEDCTMDDPNDPESFVHASWANDDADHTAEVEA